MRKKEQGSYKSIISAPIKSPSPDFKAANKIKSTKSPHQTEYHESLNVNRTPSKTFYHQNYESTPKNQRSTGYKYFSHNRPSYSPERHVEEFQATHSNDEIILELRKIIQMIGSYKIETDSLEPESSRIREQVRILQVENQRLLELINQLQIKSETKTNSKHQSLENQILVLRQQLNKNLAIYERDREELYRTNQTLTSQIKSFEDRRMILQKENEGLKYLLKEKEQAEKLRDSQTLRKNQQKMSISMIKDQYNESLKSFKDQVTYQMNYKLHSMEQALKEAQRKTDLCQQKLMVAERSQHQNQMLVGEIANLKKQLKSEQGRNTTYLLQKELENKKNEVFIWEDKYRDAVRKLSQIEQDYQAKDKEKQKYYEDKVRIKDAKISELQDELGRSKTNTSHNKDLETKIYELNLKLKEKENNLNELERQTQRKVSELMDNYDAQIKILKHELENRSSRAAILNNKEIELEKEILYLKEQLDNCRACQARQTQSYEKRLLELQLTISTLRKHIQQSDNKDGEIEQLKLKITEQNDEILRLTKALSQYQQSQLKMSGYESMIGNLKTQIKERDESLVRAESELKLKKSSEAEMKDFYEKQIQRLNSKLREGEDMKTHYEAEIQRLKSKVNEGIESKLALERQLELLQGKLEEESKMKVYLENQIQRLKLQLQQKESNSELVEKTVGIIKRDNLIEEINELKGLVKDTNLMRLEEELVKYSEMYQKELYTSQDKIRQIQRLTNEKNSLGDELAESQRSKLLLEEKIRFLQNNNKIYQTELKERKNLCSDLIEQKSGLERQLVVLKKSKYEQEQIEGVTSKAKIISQKIENLLRLEQEREKKISQITYEIHSLGKSRF